MMLGKLVQGVGPYHRCEWRSCTRQARATVHGQWTEVDWISFEVCAEHLAECRKWMRQLQIDEGPIVELWVKWYTEPTSGYLL